MTDEQSRPPACLTALQRTLIDCARTDWEQARSEDLAALDAASLILLVAKLRGRLGEMLDLIAEAGGHPPDHHHP